MRCRELYVDGEKKNHAVWFGSYGADSNEFALKWKDGTTSFANESEAVSTLLTQRLSVIRTELWNNIKFGLPLIDKVSSKEVIDSHVLEIISTTQDVRRVLSFESSLSSSHSYSCSVIVESTYGVVEVTL